MRAKPGFRIVPNWNKNINDVTISQHDVIVNFFDVVLFFLSKISHWSKFALNIFTGSGVMTIFFYKWLTRNPEIGNTPVWVLQSIWRLGQVRDNKFGTNVSHEMSLNVAKCQSCYFYFFWVIKGKPTGEREVKLAPTLRLGLRMGLFGSDYW